MVDGLIFKEWFLKKKLRRRDLLKIMALSAIGIGGAPDVFAEIMKIPAASLSAGRDDHIRDYLHKMKNFDDPHEYDITLDRNDYRTLKSTVKRLHRLEAFAGHLNFQIMRLDYAMRLARNYEAVGEFTKTEVEFMEKIFYNDAHLYGFLGEKTMTTLTARINEKDVIKIPYQGNYLYRGAPLQVFKKIRQQVGEKVILTSGVRGVMKQFLLFLKKAYRSDGNLSLASRSLAPPGYSFHGNGDFDVGKTGYGVLNFTERFTETEVYERLADLGYLRLRYKMDNSLGVRFEPWHIKTT